MGGQLLAGLDQVLDKRRIMPLDDLVDNQALAVVGLEVGDFEPGAQADRLLTKRVWQPAVATGIAEPAVADSPQAGPERVGAAQRVEIGDDHINSAGADRHRPNRRQTR